MGASRVKFGGCGTTGHRLAIEAGDADEIDAEPEGRGLAGRWGRVRSFIVVAVGVYTGWQLLVDPAP